MYREREKKKTTTKKQNTEHLLLSHCRYFDKSFTEMFLVCFSNKHIILVKKPVSLLAMATERLNVKKY